MEVISRLRLWQKLALAMLLMGLLPMAAVTYTASRSASAFISEQAFSKLEAVRQLKSNSIINHFSESERIITTFAQQPDVIRAAKALRRSFRSYLQEVPLVERRRARAALHVEEWRLHQASEEGAGAILSFQCGRRRRAQHRRL